MTSREDLSSIPEQAAWQLVATMASDMLSIHATDGTFLFCSPAAERLFGYAPHDLVGRSIRDYLHPEDVDWIEDVEHTIDDDACFAPIEYRFRCRDGGYRWVETRAREQVIDGQSRVVCVTSDVTDRHYALEALRSARDRLEELATTDALTGIPNHRAFQTRYDLLLAHARRGRPFGLILCDIDHFKRFNDDFGHQAGDRVLTLVALTLADNVREVDMVARYGGEEFVVLLPDVTELGARIVAERLRKAVAALINPYRPISMSLGFAATAGLQQIDAHTMLQAADQALYAAKSAGRNQSCAASGVERSLAVAT